MQEVKELNESPLAELAELPVELIRLIALAQPEEQLEVIRVLFLRCHRAPRAVNDLLQIHKFLQAVVDDDGATVEAMLKINPNLLFQDPPEGLVVKSRPNYHQFYAESALKMAASLKQIRMVKLLLSYYKKQEKLYKNNLENLPEAKKQAQLDALYTHRIEALSAWKPYATEDYQLLVQKLVEVFSKEDFPNGVPGQYKVPMNVNLSEATESALSDLLDDLIPEKAVSLDKHIDAELLYLAALEAFVDNYNTLGTDNRQNSFCVRVLGLIQRAFSQGTKKEFCAGLNKAIKAIENDHNSTFGSQVEECKLVCGGGLHAAARLCRQGLGFDYFGFMCRTRLEGGRAAGAFCWVRRPVSVRIWEIYVKQKQTSFQKLCRQCSHMETNTFQNVSRQTV